MTPPTQALLERLHNHIAGSSPNDLLLTDAAAELERLAKIIEQECQNWAATHTHVQQVAARYLPASVVEGDSYGMPTIEDLVDELAKLLDRERHCCEQERQTWIEYIKARDEIAGLVSTQHPTP